jgi:hypothetical protein
MKNILLPFLLLLNVSVLLAQVPTPSPTHNYVLSQTNRDAAGNQKVTSVQYVDGLGRSLQTVTHAASPQGKDLVSGHVVYDAYGPPRPKLPAGSGYGRNGGLRGGPAHAGGGFYGDARPFSQPVYEASPLSRTLEAYGPGQDWYTAQSGDRRPTSSTARARSGSGG